MEVRGIGQFRQGGALWLGLKIKPCPWRTNLWRCVGTRGRLCATGRVLCKGCVLTPKRLCNGRVRVVKTVRFCPVAPSFLLARQIIRWLTTRFIRTVGRKCQQIRREFRRWFGIVPLVRRTLVAWSGWVREDLPDQGLPIIAVTRNASAALPC